jgi:hypothetical protein
MKRDIGPPVENNVAQRIGAPQFCDAAFRFEKPAQMLNWTSMNIEIRDAALQARIQKQVEATGSSSVEEALLRLLETQEEQDRWLLETRDAINVQIRQGIDQLDRGEGIPEDQLDSYLTRLKAKSE